MQLLGIDVGGSGIKGAPVDLVKEDFLGERFRLDTPIPRKPKAMIETIGQVVKEWDWKGPVGVGFPTVVHNGKALQHGNLDAEWLGLQIDDMISQHIGLPVSVINDADAAGLAEVTFGVGKDVKGLVMTVTVGTGIGTGLFYNGVLIPNFELGQMRYKKTKTIEEYASRKVRLDNNMSFKKWGKRFNKFLQLATTVTSPDLIIIGGGASKNIEEYRKYMDVQVPIRAAKTQNHAGIIGAALCAQHFLENEK
ncbi:MAG: ROK family protein [Leeuwenhoekiella sp.]